MVNLYQAVFSLLTLRLPGPYPNAVPQEPDDSKSIAVVGAGSAGLATLKTFLDLPGETRKGWRIASFEQRADVGGIWQATFCYLQDFILSYPSA